MSIQLPGLISAMFAAMTLVGCGSLDLGEAFPRVGLTHAQTGTETSAQASEGPTGAVVHTTSATTCPKDDWVDLSGGDEVERRWKTVTSKLSAILGVDASPLPLSIVLSSLRSRLAAPGQSTSGGAKMISTSDLKQLAEQLHKKVTASPLAVNLSESKATAPQLRTLSADEKLFAYSLYYYFDALFNDKYYDRSGTKVAAPKLSMTVTDADLSSVLTVFADAIMDFVERRPVWVTSGGMTTIPVGTKYSDGYFPGPQSGSGEGEPTAVSFEYDSDMQKRTLQAQLPLQWAPLRPLADQPAPANFCDLDKPKAQAMYHVSQLVSQGVSGVTGLTVGNFGGWGISFFGYAKFSVGDNQTVEVLIKTLLARLGERVATTGTYRVLRGFDDSNFNAADIVAEFLVLINPAND